MELISKSFAQQCIAFPARVDSMLAKIETVSEAKELLDKASTMRHYAEKLKAGIEIEKPIAIGVLKIKAKIGELLPAASASERGKKGGKGNKATEPSPVAFDPHTISAYRKLAANKDKIEEYAESCDEVPTQGEFLKYVQPTHVSQNSGDNEWYTPSQFIEAARAVMGGIDLDPASCDFANKTVRARRIYDANDDGLSKKWTGRVWLNPPYSKELCSLFIAKVVDHYKAGDVAQTVILVNNATETNWGQVLLQNANAVCFVCGRIKFLDEQGNPVNAPLQGQMICYLGAGVDLFCDSFDEFGKCFVPQQSKGER